MTHSALVEYLVETGYLKTGRLVDAFCAVDRAHFVTEEYQDMAYADTALPIGYGATISQPATVAFMLETLAPKEGDMVLDIGSGSGWTTTLLAYAVGPKGRVFGVEIVAELVERGGAIVAKRYPELNPRIMFKAVNAIGGLPDEAPFHRIIAAATLVSEVPHAWKEQLVIGGKIVAPVRDSIILVERTAASEFKERVFPGFVFVPFQY